MTCAGYLVVGNSHAAFVEICTGVLVCSLDVASRADVTEASEHSLPPLEPRRMAKLEVCTTRASAHKMEDKPRQPEDELEPQSEPAKHQRLLQLSGFMIEVLDRDDELDEPSLPFSFQVNTYKMHLRPDGSSSSTLSDSLVLSATDEEAKKFWVKSIKFWNRYGWRDTEQVAATHDDLVKLQELLQNYSNPQLLGAYPRHSSDEAYYRDHNNAMLYGGRSSFQSSCATRRQTRRRFYRTAMPGSFAPPS
ncbi:hypothetical protein PF005_g11366 [Phytophthora fragariae]|uniref:PH domain-containing protein n=1 Tax=Phytophthora fragariae TaxID=53985 RepID=A0A6A3EXD9_9STRA|nr:hypothetical protein PF003_g39289 [Phytophthora fragariae]KAE8937353.1 hypothetical protein PF009_g12744 [Phytophthora fragariae]KAE9008130.1 hypothetical protein PF011_g10824 [Phytophthora fragariae]KAE9109589.1 hypothetical protein PF007_g12189 [Phytophthora fragariae]KAE9109614.1 hypothetical protein PF010_g11476 [Phytophthora fragariae]